MAHDCATTRVGLALVAITVTIVMTSTQSPERFRARLSIVPVDFASVATTSGSGEVTAELRGREFTVEVMFAGLSSPATRADVRNAEKGQRGAVAFTLDIGTATATAGAFDDTVTLTETQVAELRQERYYLQIRTEGNPNGEIRGWFLVRE